MERKDFAVNNSTFIVESMINAIMILDGRTREEAVSIILSNPEWFAEYYKEAEFVLNVIK